MFADAIRVPRAQRISMKLCIGWTTTTIDAIRVPRAQTKCNLSPAAWGNTSRCNPCTTCIRFASIAWHKKSRTSGAWLSCVAGKSAIAI